MASIFLASFSRAYFLAVFMSFSVNLIRQHGLILNQEKALKLLWPVFKAMLMGLGPAVILSLVIQQLVPFLHNAQLLVIPIGELVSAVLLHRMFLAEISNKRNWNIAIAILAVVLVAPFGFLQVQLQSSL